METVVKWSTRVTVAHLFASSNLVCLPSRKGGDANETGPGGGVTIGPNGGLYFHELQ